MVYGVLYARPYSKSNNRIFKPFGWCGAKRIAHKSKLKILSEVFLNNGMEHLNWHNKLSRLYIPNEIFDGSDGCLLLFHQLLVRHHYSVCGVDVLTYPTKEQNYFCSNNLILEWRRAGRFVHIILLYRTYLAKSICST